MVILASFALIAVAFVLWLLFYVRRSAKPEPGLSDGSVLLISDGRVRRASADAITLLGECLDQPVVTVLESFLGPDQTAIRDSVNRLEMTGEPINLLAYTPDNRAFEIIGAPAGGLIRLVIRNANYMDVKLRAAEERVKAADSVLKTHQWEQDTMRSLVSSGPIIAWNRNEDGTLNWSAGQIQTRTVGITADQTVELIIARTKLNRQPIAADEPQKSRIEIVVNDTDDTVSLHVTEIIGPNGTRIGFATDAGTAASAERTLTRFVQTMTETFAHLTVGLAIFDRNQTLALFNPALVQMWQVEPAWLARRPSLREIIDELRSTRRLPELQDYHAWRAQLLSLFDNTEAADYEELWHLADGSNIRVLARPHPHGSLAFIFDDVTERMRLEQRYRHSIDLRRATLDRLTEGIAVFGANGLLQFVNQAFHGIWQTDSETVYAAMHARQLAALCEELTVEVETWQQIYGYITGDEERRSWTSRLTLRSGRVLIARISPLPDGSTMAVFADMTDSERVALVLQERNEALELAEEMRASLMSQVSDRLRRPITTVNELIRDLQTGNLPEDAARLRLTGIREASNDLMDAIVDVSELTSLPVQPFGIGSSECDLRECLHLAQAMLNQKAAGSPVKIDLTGTDEKPIVYGDSFRLRQLLCSMGKEVLKQTSPGKEMTVGAVVSDETYTLFVETWSSNAALPKKVGGSESTELQAIRELAVRLGGSMLVKDDRSAGHLHIACQITTAQDMLADVTSQNPTLTLADETGDGQVAALPPVRTSAAE
jgi:PAS domain-containing protein